ncbi:MAG: efflux RND transporter periplasmic adaptor subunit [Candidatus Sericytochromatia bacterium]|nr:efflux RND transporter periplasmic adaptor subunit [Candidatus Sericytochromatia bacterium]
MLKLLIPFGLLLCLLTACHAGDHAESGHEAHGEPLRLKVTQPLKRDTQVPQDYVARIQARSRIELRSLERGYLEKIYVDEGQWIKKGQLMFRLKPNVYLAELKKFQAEARIAELEYQNTRSLADSAIVSGNELAISKAKLEKARAEVGLAQTHLNFTEIRAPFSGLMDHFEVREGSLLDEGELLTTLSDIEKVWVYFNVSETEYLGYAAAKDKKWFQQVQLEMANGQLFPHRGTVETIEGEFDSETGNIEIRAAFPNPDRLLRHGETGRVIVNRPYPGAILIPQRATFEVLDKKYVFVLDKEQKVKQRAITVAAELPHLYVVQSGLKPEDRLLLEGLRKVREGQVLVPDFVAPEKVYSQLDVHAE